VPESDRVPEHCSNMLPLLAGAEQERTSASTVIVCRFRWWCEGMRQELDPLVVISAGGATIHAGVNPPALSNKDELT
jgi:hypothetical protein